MKIEAISLFYPDKIVQKQKVCNVLMPYILDVVVPVEIQGYNHKNCCIFYLF